MFRRTEEPIHILRQNVHEKIIEDADLQKHIDAARLLGIPFSLVDYNIGTEENKVHAFRMCIWCGGDTV